MYLAGIIGISHLTATMSSGSLRHAVLGPCTILALVEWALTPAAKRPAVFVALILREIWSLNTLARGSITAFAGVMASGAPTAAGPRQSTAPSVVW